MIRVTFLFSHPVLDRVWDRAAARLAVRGIAVRVLSQSAAIDWTAFAEDSVALADAAWVEVTRASAGFGAVIAAAQRCPFAVAAGLESRAALGDARAACRTMVSSYLRAGTEADLENAVLALLQGAGRIDQRPPPPTEPLLLGIHHPAASQPWDDSAAYLDWAASRLAAEAPAVAILFDRNAWLNDDLAAIDALISGLEEAGLVPVALFCASDLARGWGRPDHPLSLGLEVLGPRLAAIWNAAGLHGADIESDPFTPHAVPVIQLLRDWSHDEEGWRADERGLNPVSVIFGLTRPEMMGTTDPTLFACTWRGDGEIRRAVPVADQIARLVGRTRALIRLRERENADKSVAILLHNPPCKGMEATIGSAPGLDALDSAVRLLHRLGDEGYDVGTPPADGAALLNLIRDHRAVQEFRWTTTGEIIARGGALALIDEASYRADFASLPEPVRTAIDAAWGAFPGQAMVAPASVGGGPALVISGLRFGNILVMTEPKRGCHRARCDGEVCRILHDPQIPPPHHWLATFWFLRRTIDAVVVMGSESPLEYLPGKRTALSESCYPVLSLGDLPVIQPSLISAMGETMMARRRGRAVTIGHLGAPVARADSLGGDWDELEEITRQYQGAEGARRGELAARLSLALRAMGLIGDAPAAAELDTAIESLPRRLRSLRARTLALDPHVLGRVPDDTVAGLYVAEARGTNGRPVDEDRLRAALAESGGEQDAVLAALSGRFVTPGPGGHLSRGRVECLPTGRNPFGVDLRRIPTEAAWAVGARMGEKLLRAWSTDSDEPFPRTVGLSLWSSDAFQADGETIAQALWLLGCRPCRDANGRVEGVEPIPLADLVIVDPDGSVRPRPRLDVVVQISGVVRDTLPGLCGLIDRAVALVAALDEPPERNLLRAHVEERLAVLAKTMSAERSVLRRLAQARVFGPAEGGYGGAMGLALDASAWDSDADLAEIVVNRAGQAYGAGGVALAGGEAMLGEYAEALRRTDLWCQRQGSPEADLLSSSCGIEGGGAAAAARRGLGGGRMRLFWSDSQTGPEGEVRSLAEELTQSLALTLLNPAWLARTRTQGYGGAQAMSDRVNRLFGWSATAHAVSRAQFDAVHDRLVGDSATRDWLMQTNPHALDEIVRRLLEAQARGLWQIDAARLSALQAAMLAVEGDQEERRGTVEGEFQGGAVTILTESAVKEWTHVFRVR
ncbi:cobaltochelatase subunit CobN [Magnetospirillum fulvum]|uniref:Cobaltochelatase n=1 Tax=Magnetospirillum fulvum MGU-K5 TaxID=1316936 RepID=S9THS7_MAGFU|nr:cobaltochelatase subunit CobN [Magnetospirillum fulvum]EPY01831.1 cobaltochelatase [Magnetospirillum fulvum MGU-K5]